MRTIISKMILFTGVMMLISCGKDKKEQLDANSETVNHEVSDDIDFNKTNTSSQVVFEDEAANKIYAAYLKVKSGLVNTDATAVQNAARQLESVLQDDDAVKNLKATTRLISVTKGIEKQRDFFVALTSEMEKLISNQKITSGEIFKQFCPMAFDNKGGYWLSDSKEVRNPYFGNRMLKCGEVKEILK